MNTSLVSLDGAQGVLLDTFDAIDCAIDPFQSHRAPGHENCRTGKEENPLACRKESKKRVGIPNLVSICPVYVGFMVTYHPLTEKQYSIQNQ